MASVRTYSENQNERSFTPFYYGISEIEHSFYLIGDAGNANINESLDHLEILKNEGCNSYNIN